MSDDDKTKDQLRSELAEIRAEQSRLLTIIEKLQDEAITERQAHHRERQHFASVAERSAGDLAIARQEAAAERQELRAEVSRFKLDVDEQVKEMARHKMRSERIVENIPVGIAYLDKALTYRWVNPAFTHLVKLPFGELIGRTFVDALPAAQGKVDELLRDVITSGEPNQPVKLPFVHSYRRKDQPTHWDMLALPLLGDNDQVDGVLVALEATERVERERVQRAEIEKLSQLDLLKGQFISMVSHELRTPLSAIAGYAEFLEDDLSGPLTPEQRSYVTAIQEAEGRIRHIVDDLLDFARIEAGTFSLELQPTDLVAVVKRAIGILVPEGLAASVTSQLETSSASIMVLGDARRLGQVVVNLVGNAIKFTPAGGNVVITIDVVGKAARLCVRDTGIGIELDELPKVFGKFYQIDASSTRERGGTGLGLAISKSLIERQGGRIGVESEPGRGSTFWFTVPLAPAGGPPPPVVEIVPPAPEARPKP